MTIKTQSATYTSNISEEYDVPYQEGLTISFSDKGS